jgi:hypothetical protein
MQVQVPDSATGARGLGSLSELPARSPVKPEPEPALALSALALFALALSALALSALAQESSRRGSKVPVWRQEWSVAPVLSGMLVGESEILVARLVLRAWRFAAVELLRVVERCEQEGMERMAERVRWAAEVQGLGSRGVGYPSAAPGRLPRRPTGLPLPHSPELD